MEQPRWRNWIAHQTSNLGVVGSIPTRGVLLGTCFAVLHFTIFL